MNDVLTLGHTGRYRIDWIRRDDGTVRYRVTGFRLDGDPEEPPRVDACPTPARRHPAPGPARSDAGRDGHAGRSQTGRRVDDGRRRRTRPGAHASRTRPGQEKTLTGFCGASPALQNRISRFPARFGQGTVVREVRRAPRRNGCAKAASRWIWRRIWSRTEKKASRCAGGATASRR